MPWHSRRDLVDFFISYAPADERWATWMAWELEQAGYRTMLQVWDFVPGTNFIDFMDRGLSRSTAILAVLSEHYLRSRYGRLEWQTAIRSAPDDPGRRLITVRIAECELEGLLSTITFLDLVGVTEPAVARERLLTRIGQAMAGRAKPATTPGYPTLPSATAEMAVAPRRSGAAVAERHGVPEAVRATPFPTPGRVPVTMLHLISPRCTSSGPKYSAARRLYKQIGTALDRAMASGAEAPTVVVVTGDLTERGRLREFDEALALLVELRSSLNLTARQFALVPGPCDINQPACAAYFFDCEANEVRPEAPYSAKWVHYVSLFAQFYRDAADVTFNEARPWSMFTMPDVGVVVAGLNSTIADSHRADDHYGWLGEEQVEWFDRQLELFTDADWWRVGAVGHAPTVRSRSPHDLRDAARLGALTGRLDLLLHNRRRRRAATLVSLSGGRVTRVRLGLEPPD